MLPTAIGVFVVPRILKEFDQNVQVAALVIPCHRVVWAFVVALLIFNNARNRGGSLDWFLSLSMWRPLVKLTYIVYLVHIPLIVLMAKKLRTEMYFDNGVIVILGLGIYVASLFIAAPIHLLVEEPFINLERHLFNRRASKSNKID